MPMDWGAGADSGRSEVDAVYGVDRRRIVVLLRSVVIATSAYLVMAGEDGAGLGSIVYVTVFAASNVALAFASRSLFYRPQFGPGLLLVDTGLILIGMFWNHAPSQDLLLTY